MRAKYLNKANKMAEAINRCLMDSTVEEVSKELGFSESEIQKWIDRVGIREDESHGHHFVVAGPRGSWSVGVCHFCGESDVFPNFGPEWSIPPAKSVRDKLNAKLRLGRVFGMRKRTQSNAK